MTLKTAVLIVVLLSAAGAQTTDRVFHFAPADTPAARQIIQNAMRSIAEIQYTSIDADAGTLTVSSTPELLGLAEWLFTELERTGPPPGATAVREYLIDRADFPIVRVFSLAHAAGPQSIQEITNSVRSLAEVQRVVVTQTVIMLRATLDQANFAEWIVRQLDKTGATGVLDYTFNDPRSPAVRIFHLTNVGTPQAIQELVNTIRSIAEIQRIVAHVGTSAILARGAPAQSDLARWLVQELDAPTAGAVHTYSGPLDGPYVVKTIAAPTAAMLPEFVAKIRSTAGIQRVVANTFAHRIVLRGAADQIAIAERLIRDAN
jgi:hypothetical protein